MITRDSALRGPAPVSEHRPARPPHARHNGNARRSPPGGRYPTPQPPERARDRPHTGSAGRESRHDRRSTAKPRPGAVSAAIGTRHEAASGVMHRRCPEGTIAGNLSADVHSWCTTAARRPLRPRSEITHRCLRLVYGALQLRKNLRRRPDFRFAAGNGNRDHLSTRRTVRAVTTRLPKHFRWMCPHQRCGRSWHWHCRRGSEVHIGPCSLAL